MTKAFHFIEVDWIILFPNQGNKGKYVDYRVRLIDGNKKTQQSEALYLLGDILEKSEISESYPHTVGFYKISQDRIANTQPEYLETRKIRVIEEFWEFLNRLNL